MGPVFQFLPGITHSHGETTTLQKRVVREIVTDKANLIIIDTFLGEDFFVNALFLKVTLVDIGNLQNAGSFINRLRITTADNTGFDTAQVEKMQPGSILRVEALKLGGFAVRSWEIIKGAVCEHTVNIHQDKFDAARPFLDLV